MMKSSSVSGDIYTQERTDGSQSDTALGTVSGGSKKRRSSISARFVAIVGKNRSRSTSQISDPGELHTQTVQTLYHYCPLKQDYVLLRFSYNLNTLSLITWTSEEIWGIIHIIKNSRKIVEILGVGFWVTFMPSC